MILFVTAADTEILALSRAREVLPQGFPGVAWATLADEPDVRPGSVVIVRLLGGRNAWPDGFERLAARCAAVRVPLLAFGGEDSVDADLAGASTVAPGVLAETFEYLRHGGVRNMANALRFVADTLLLYGFGFEPPEALPDHAVYAERGAGADRPADAERSHDPDRPTVGVVFYRAHHASGNTAFVDDLCDAVHAAGANALAVYAYSLRPDAAGRIPAVDLMAGRVDVLIVTMLASGGSNAADAEAWTVPAFETLDVPVIQGICVTTTRDTWRASAGGLSPMDAATQVAMPEFDGRIVSVPFSFKEAIEGDASVRMYRADPGRTRALAELAVRTARLRRVPPSEKRVALVLSSYPTRHSRVGNAVGLDTPASAVRLLGAMRDAGYVVEGVPDHGDDLIHALVAAGGYDESFLTDTQLAAAHARLDTGAYAAWFETLPADLREAVVAHWGEPPGDLYVHDGSIVMAGLRLGNVFVAIQPPRGFGENPVAIYHDPELSPSHHYLASYRWLDAKFGAHAVVHLGKHGTLEWLPGKSLALSGSCAPDAVLGALPLVYPFIVNDPGEGTQAKRRAHAVVVDHLVPAMQRAETYDDLARLEQLMDEHAQLQSLDPAKLPEIRRRIWELVTRARLHVDLGVGERPEQFDEFLLHLDGYLCEVKDVQIRDGLHVLGEAPRGDQRTGLVLAILRAFGLRAAIGRAFGLDEQALMDKPGAEVVAPPGLGEARTAGDLIDRLEEASRRALETGASFGDAEVERLLAFAREVVEPRLDRTPDEIANVLRALDGRFVAAGPSGSPTRGRVDVLPTGRNFYSVDPKALPSELAYATGVRLADDLLARSLAEDGAYPSTVGIVVWGTPAMRTHGDDIGEVLALLGVRPRWDERSRRVTGLDVVGLEELGRPRIDVTVRISGFFRDAFPNLVELMDDAVALVAGLDEPDDVNFVARHVRAAPDVARHVRAGAAGARPLRIFGSKPGAYGAGLLPLIDARNWRDDADLARVYEVWGGYAYGRDLNGVHAPDEMRSSFARIRVAVKNVDTVEHDLLDSDDYFQYHGGMVAMVRSLTGSNPQAYIADSSDPKRIRTRTLAEETRRIFRARVVNPRWISSMMRHGYKGAFELSATVDYLFGYDATAGVVDDWMYEAVAQRYVLDAETSAFLKRSNPWALQAIAERLLEAAERSLWADADPATLDALREVYLEVDGDLEGRSTTTAEREARSKRN